MKRQRQTLPPHVQVAQLYRACGGSVRVSRWAPFAGWLSITDEDRSWHVMWTTGRTTHLCTRPALAVDIDKATGGLSSLRGVTGAWKSAISMWPVFDVHEAARVHARVCDLIRRAHATHAKRIEAAS